MERRGTFAVLSKRGALPFALERGASGAVRWEPRGTSRLENSGLGLDMGSFQGVRDPGPPRGEEQQGWAVRGCSSQPRLCQEGQDPPPGGVLVREGDRKSRRGLTGEGSRGPASPAIVRAALCPRRLCGSWEPGAGRCP